MAFPMTINSQEEFNELLKDRLAREAEKYKGFEDFKDKASKYDDLVSKNYPSQLEAAQKALADKDTQMQNLTAEWQKKFDDAAASSAQKAADDAKALAEIQAKLSNETIANLKLQAALDAGLPYQMADRLRGTTAEELKADAAAMAPLLAKTPSNPFAVSDPGGTAIVRDPTADTLSNNPAALYNEYAKLVNSISPEKT